MTKTITSALSAFVLASAFVGGASSAFASGDYYSGAGAAPITVGGSASSGTGTAATVKAGGDGEYYVGLDRNPIDTTATGSIVKGGAAPAPARDSGDYFPGASR
ncbi:hypothetical protein [Ensifer soli]|uniref:hypothetical protein n=1 Tax=Ciceribacter sp. sgz301302 TaxID=3342379 RepID=UPI0035B7BCDA